MSVFFAFLLFAPLSRAGVIAPVESSVAPAGPTAPAVRAPVTVGSLGAVFGLTLDVQGGLPLLPAPVPGLLGSRLNFVGDARPAVEPRAESAAPSATSDGSINPRARVDKKTPILPGQTDAGASLPAMSRDRGPREGPATGESSLGRVRDAVEVEATLGDDGRLENAVSRGRILFDESSTMNGGTYEPSRGVVSPGPDISANVLESGVFGLGSGLKVRARTSDPDAVFGAGHDGSRYARIGEGDGDVLRDALASAPGSPDALQIAGGIRSFAAPNGNPTAAASFSGQTAGAAPFAVRPFALDLSRSGLIVRVHSAAEPASTFVGSPMAAARQVLPGASTDLLERGAMREAFAVASAFANSSDATGLPAGEAAILLSPARAVERVPLLFSWGWILLPALIAAFRSFL